MSIQSTYDQIVAEKQSMAELQDLQPNIDDAQTLLDDVTSDSKVAEWRLWCWVMAVIQWAQEQLFVQHKKEIETIVAAASPGNLAWYAAKVREWQYGDTLVFIDNQYVYPNDNPAARLVDRVAVRDASKSVLIKAAKAPGGNVQPLSTPELAALTAYLNDIKVAGTDLVVTSLNPDKLVAVIDVYYDGLRDQGELTTELESATNNYLDTLPFDGRFVRQSLIDALQIIDGVRYLKVQQLDAIAGSSTIPIDVFYESEAGYFTSDPAQGTSLTFNLIPS